MTASESKVFSRASGLAAWKQVADSIEADIAAGRISPGDRIAPEAQLAERFGVNRHTVRRGLADLAERGLVRATQGSGTFVEARPLAYPIGLKTRFSEVMAKAGKEARGELVSAEHGNADAATAEALKIKPGAPVLDMLTVNRADGVPLSLARTFLPLPRFLGLEQIFATKGSLTKAYKKFGLDDYKRLSTRITARPAAADEAQMLDIAPGRTLLIINAINVDMDGKPIQSTLSRFVADRVELVVER
ncbi:phosphonate metabolism transcriptional regulator PhnF [Terrihabitans soli]|uniref:Phosphonate metabolism transcriptional regulator PhnF n=1 Tax=Terrihabitans soli TaxID=708113 RepID=A0A6S6QKB6_9HYPH|nr:phosphonate metabolism transcriptional regulator PhnF [Terrihabitans soli]BCJ89686.1 phosphonate metabolism transcriptional regulator PhnF [Terrihabitans soli]